MISFGLAQGAAARFRDRSISKALERLAIPLISRRDSESTALIEM
jgi:hypothetical protein